MLTTAIWVFADQERRWCFNITLLIAGVFGLAAGGANNFITLASLLAVMGVGVGGNLPIDSAVFLGGFTYKSSSRTKLKDLDQTSYPHRTNTS